MTTTNISMNNNHISKNKQNSEEVVFLPDMVIPKLYDIIEDFLSKEVFDHKMIKIWSDIVCSKTMEVLKALNRPYKYIGR